MSWLLIGFIGFGAPRVDVAPGGGCKCDSAAAPALAWAPLLVAGLALARRRR